MVAVADLLMSRAQFGITPIQEKEAPGFTEPAKLAAGMLEDKMKRDADAFNVEAETNLRLFGTEALEQARVEAKNPEEITQLFFDKYKTKRDELYKNAPNSFAKQGLDDLFGKLKNTYGQQAINTQVNETQKYRFSKLENSIDNIATSIRNGGDYNAGIEAFNSAFTQAESFTSAADRERLKPKFAQQAKTGRLDFLFEAGRIDEVDSLIKDKNFNADLDVKQIDAYRNAVARQREETGLDASLVNYLTRGEGYVDPENPKVKRSISRVYEQAIEPLIMSGDSEQAANGYRQAVDLISKTGVVPSKMSGMIRSAYYGSGADKDLAYRLVSDINNTNPKLLESIGVKDAQINEAMLYNQLKDDGVEDTQIDRVIQARLYPKDKATFETRKEELKKAKKTFDIADFMDDSILPFTEPDIIEIPGLSVNKKVQFERRMNDLYESFYLETGDVKLAEERAKQAFKKNHGITKITGEYVTDYPPENYYRHPIFNDPYEGDKTSEWMREQLVNDVSETLNKKVKADDLRVVADGLTVKKINDGMLPDYQVYIDTPDDGFQYIGRMKWDLPKAIEQQAVENTDKRKLGKKQEGKLIDFEGGERLK